MFKYMDRLVKKLKSSEKGQGMVEYALIIAFVAAIAIVALNNGLGDAIKSAFTQATTSVKEATDAADKYSDKDTSGGDPPETPTEPGEKVGG